MYGSSSQERVKWINNWFQVQGEDLTYLQSKDIMQVLQVIAIFLKCHLVQLVQVHKDCL